MMWQRDTSGECSREDEGSTTITDGSTSYDIMGLAGISSYSITVTATNVAGSSAVSDAVTAMTFEAGERRPFLLLPPIDIKRHLQLRLLLPLL